MNGIDVWREEEDQFLGSSSKKSVADQIVKSLARYLARYLDIPCCRDKTCKNCKKSNIRNTGRRSWKKSGEKMVHLHQRKRTLDGRIVTFSTLFGNEFLFIKISYNYSNKRTY